MKLVETWVKAPFLKGASLLIVSECAQTVFPQVYDEFAEGRVILTSCPEMESAGLVMGKLATLLTCANPREVTVLTIEGSPHCFMLHAALNQALFVIKTKVPAGHFVIMDGRAVKVSSASVRVGRYLHLVQKCIERYPEVLRDLKRYSLEHGCPAKP